MGLLDSVLGAVMGGAQEHGGLASALEGLLSNDGGHGGLPGLVDKFNQAGLGNVVQSWIGSGANLPISAEQLQGVLGSDTLRGLATQLGVDPAQASQTLSQLLPGLVDQLTPGGAAPTGGLGGGADVLGMLGGLLRKA
ncbi:MAG: YidB family protein [Burkholderiaceae bacterium]